MTALKRRSFLQLAVVALSATPRPQGSGPAASSPWSPEALGSAEALGRAYLRRHPEETEETLRAALAPLELATEANRRERILEQVRGDFGDERTVQVEGWLISLTEARLAGLAALEADYSPGGFRTA